MSTNRDNLLIYLPFASLTDYELGKEYELPKQFITSLMNEKGFSKALQEQRFINVLNGIDTIQCKYYDSNELAFLKLDDYTNLKIFSINISSLPRHAGELLCFLSSLETDFDALVISEIGGYNLSTIGNIFKGYTCFLHPPTNNPKGGIAIFINNKLGRIKRIIECEIIKTCGCAICEIECICLSFECYDVRFNILGIYRHPKGNKKHFIYDLSNTLGKLDGRVTTYLIGDINIDLLLYDKNKDHSDYASMLFSKGFMPYITFPTRITPHSATLIDHIFVRSPNNDLESISGILYSDISDHLPCFISSRFKKRVKLSQRPQIRLYGQKQCNDFAMKMANFNWSELYINNSDWYKQFVTTVLKIFESSFPFTTLSRKRMKDKIWITQGLKKSCQTNSRLYKQSIRHPNSPSSRKYTAYNKLLKKCIKKAEISYHAEILRKNVNSIKNTWKHLNTLISCKKSHSKHFIDKIIMNGKVYRENIDISNAMNDHFCKIGETLQSNLPECENDSFKKYLPPGVVNSFVLSHASINDIIREIKLLDPKKSSGPDGIGPKIIKLCPDIFAENLLKIFNRSIDLGEYPSDMKIAKVIALYKKGRHSDPNNYRPISLLSCFNKIFERLVCIQLNSFLEKYNIYVDFQFGFRRGHSTILALTEITDNIKCQIDKGHFVLGLFIDLSKAFDTVDHEILLSKLWHYGIRGHANKFFRSYLSGRKQFTYVNDEKSELKDVKCGVPQGSVLGPVLFLLFVNDMYRAVIDSNIRLFADDTSLFTSGPHLDSLISESVIKYKNIFQWCIDNRLTINYSKTCFLLFHARNKRMPFDLNEIKVGDVTISRAKETKYLGLQFDENLSWKSHVTNVCHNLVKYFGIFKKLRDYISVKLAKQIYHALIFSRINYGIQVYGSCSVTLLSKIQVLSNRLLKFLLKLDINTSTSTLHKKLNILTVKDNYELNVLSFVRNCLQGECPNLFKNYFVYNLHRYSVRTPKLQIKPHRTTFASKSVSIMGAVLWNNLEEQFKSKAVLKSFRSILKSMFISRYE